MTTLSAEGLAWLKHREGCRLRAYRDVGGVWTIGYGHTGPDVLPDAEITQAQAGALLAQDCGRFERLVDQHIRVLLVQSEFDALVSLAFNCGVKAIDPKSSTLARELNLGNRRACCRNWARWCKVSGTYNEGLAMRRAEEVYQFCGGWR